VALAALESRMTHIAGLERDQLLLLPEAVDDYVGSDNPVRFIDAFVDGFEVRFQIRAVVCSLPRASLLAGAGVGLLFRGLRA
jgi:hypothetical protein